MTSRMTATDELRRLLDDRGIEHMDFNMPERSLTLFAGDEHDGAYTENSVDTILTVYGASPKQAVEATLGRGTCRDLAETPEYRDKTEFKCSECGYEYSALGGFGCDAGDAPDFRYCPNCGRKVVDA